MSSLRACVAGLIILGMAASSAEAGGRSRGCTPRYRGNWQSDCNGHNGTLKAKVKADECGSYRVTFSGTFFRVVPFVYSTPMTVTGASPDGTVHLHGHSRLPVFGEFDCQAAMNGNQFNANYTSARDQGRFSMQRR